MTDLVASTFTTSIVGIDTHQSTSWQVATDSGFSNIFFESLEDVTNLTSITIPTMLADETYYARVRFHGATYTSDWSSATHNFSTILAFVETPTVTYPTEGVSGVPQTFTATASVITHTPASAATHVETDWQIATDAGFTNIVFQSIDDSINLTSILATTGSDGQFYVRVRYKNSSDTESSWSTAVSFSTLSGYGQRIADDGPLLYYKLDETVPGSTEIPAYFDPDELGTRPGESLILSGGLLQRATAPASGLQGSGTRTTLGHSTGKYYCEFQILDDGFNSNLYVGLSNTNTDFSISQDVPRWGANTPHTFYRNDARVYRDGSQLGIFGASWVNGDIIGIASDLDAGSVSYYRNGSLTHTTTGTFSGQEMFPSIYATNVSFDVFVRLQSGEFTYTPPAGYSEWGFSSYSVPADTVAIDSSGNANDGTYKNQPTLNQTSLVVGEPSSVSFDGIDDYIVHSGSLPAAINTASFTMEFWAKADTFASNPTIGGFFNTAATTGGQENVFYSAFFSDGSIGVVYYDGASTVVLNSTATYSTNTLYHIVVTVDRTEPSVRLFVNGVEDSGNELPHTAALTGNGADISIADVFAIGVDFDAPGAVPSQTFDGLMDEVAVYDRVLTQQEITDHYNLGKYGSAPTYSDMVIADAPVAYYKLDETTGTTATDSSGNAHDGTYINGPLLNQTTLVQGEPASVKFNGVDEVVSIPDVNMLSETELTLEAWVTSDVGIAGQIFYHGDNGEFQIGTTGSGSLRGVEFAVKLTDQVFYVVNTPQIIAAGDISHIACTWSRNSSRMKIYLNGALRDETTVPNLGLFDAGNNGSYKSAIGARGHFTNGLYNTFFSGTIDEVAYYNYEFSSRQILNHYNLGKYGLAAPTYNGIVVADGPVAYYTMDDLTGTSVIADSSGNGRDATPSGASISYEQAGVVGTAIRFPGNNQAWVPHESILNFNGDFSVEFWYKRNSTPETFPNLVSKGNNGLSGAWLIYESTSGVIAYKRNGTEHGSSTTPVSNILTEFSHVVVTYDDSATELKFYINGVNTNTITTALADIAGTSGLEIGDGSRQADATMDEVALYDRILLPYEVAEHYNLGKYGDIIPVQFSLTYTGDNYSIVAQSTNVGDIQFNDDGTKFFVHDLGSRRIYQYTLSTPYDFGTATYNTNFSFGGQLANSHAFTFDVTGTRVYVTGFFNNVAHIAQYSVTTPFDFLSGVSFVSRTLIHGTTFDRVPNGIIMNDAGTIMITAEDETPIFRELTLSTPFDASTATYSGRTASFHKDGVSDQPLGMTINKNKYRILVTRDRIDFNQRVVDQYTIDNFDISTLSFDNQVADISAQVTGSLDATGIALADDDQYVLIADRNTDKLYRYTAY